jgi:hypothetical protein
VGQRHEPCLPLDRPKLECVAEAQLVGPELRDRGLGHEGAPGGEADDYARQRWMRLVLGPVDDQVVKPPDELAGDIHGSRTDRAGDRQ